MDQPSESVGWDKTRLSIAEKGGFGASLVSLLNHNSPQVKDLTNAAISSLNITEEGVITIRSLEGLIPLFKLAKIDESEVQCKAVWAIAIIASQNGGNLRLFNLKGSWLLLKRLSFSQNTATQWGIANIVGHMALYGPNLPQMVEKGVVQMLKVFSTSESLYVRRSAMNAFALLSSDAKNAAILAQDGGIDFVMTQLKYNDLELQRAVVHCIANIANAGEVWQEEIVKWNGIELLQHLLQNKDWILQQTAALCLCRLTTNSNVCKEFCTRGSFEVLFELLVIEDLDLRLSLVTTINNLSQHTSCRDRMLASIEISKKTKETDNLAFLIQLIRNTEDHDIQRECLSAVKQLHPEFFDPAMYAAAQLQMLDSMASSEDDDEDNAPKLSKRELKRVESKKEARKSDKKAKDDKDKKDSKKDRAQRLRQQISNFFSTDKKLSQDALARLLHHASSVTRTGDKKTDFIKAMLALVQDKSHGVQKQAIIGIRRLAKRGTKSKSLVRHSGAVEILMEAVKSDKKPRSVLSVALRTLSYLITTVKDQNKIRESGLFPYLVNIAESSPSDKIRQNAIKLIFKAIFDNATSQFAMRNAGGLKLVQNILNSPTLDTYYQSLACRVISGFSYSNATIQKQIVEMGILDKLIEVVRSSPSVMLLYRSIDAIHASCFNNNTNKELVLRSGGIEQIIALLDENESTNVPNVLLSCVLSCLSALADGNPEIQKYIYEKNVLHLLGAQLQKDDASLLGHATRCLMDLLKNNVVMQEALAKSNEKILEKIVELLDSDHQGVQQNCVALLALLARIEEGHKRILDTDFKRRLLALLKTNNVEMRQLAEVCLRLLSNVADESF